MNHEKTLLFIPMYNCEKQIIRVLNQLKEEVVPYIDEVIIVNNRSTDKSEQEVVTFLESETASLPVNLLRNQENYGLGGSHKVAFNYALEHGFDYVIVLHGDDQGSLQDILPVLQSEKHKLHDSMLGSRFEKGSVLTNYSAFRIFGNHIFNFLISMIAKRRLTDLGSGLNIYKVSYLKSKFYLQFSDTLTFNVYMLLYGVYSKSDFNFFPLTWREEDQMSNAKLFSQSLEIMSLGIKFIKNPDKLFQNTSGRKEYFFEEVKSWRASNE